MSDTLAPRRAAARRRGRTRLEIAVLSAPAVLVFLAFVIFPVALAAYYGFYRWKGYGDPTDWVGLNNYRLILIDPAFHDVLWHNGLILVLSLLLYSISARDSLARPGFFDALQLVLVIAAIAVDAVMLTAMLTRIAEFGFSPNKIAALGLNLLLLVHLVRAAWLTVGFLRGRRPFGQLENWQTRYLPVYGAWGAVVVVLFPPVFGFI